MGTCLTAHQCNGMRSNAKISFHISFYILYKDQQMRNYLTNYHTPPTCFDTSVSSSGSS